MQARYYTLLALVFLLPLAVAASSQSVAAQSSCTMQINGPMTANAWADPNSDGYYDPGNPSSIQLTIPLAAGCPNMGSALWAIADINDTVTNAKVNTANTVFNYSGNYYIGQLTFTLPPSVMEHPLHFAISLFNSYSNGQYSSFIGTYSGDATLHAKYYYGPRGQYTYYYNGYTDYYPYYNYPGYPNSCYNGQMVIFYYNGTYYYASCYP